jgi:hypothetical protein
MGKFVTRNFQSQDSHVGFVVDKVALGYVYVRVPRFPLASYWTNAPFSNLPSGDSAVVPFEA